MPAKKVYIHLRSPHMRLIPLSDRIRDFLSKFKWQEKDLAQNFANIGIDDNDRGVPAELQGLKYMSQLVSVWTPFDA